MQTIYKIINFNAATGQLVVEWHPDFPRVAIDLPIDDNNQFPTGEALDTYIRGFVPVWELERIEKLKSVTNADAIAALVQKPSLTTDINTQSFDSSQNNLLGL